MTRKTWSGDDRGLIWVARLDRRGGGLGMGLLLIGLGVFILLGQQGLLDRELLRAHWPWILVIVGFGTLLTARSSSRVGDGVFVALLGGWFLIMKSEWQGLTWRNGWPLVLVAIGASFVAKALAGVFLPEKQPRRVPADDTTGKEDDRHA
jgi:hypothetical protein